MNSIFIYLIIIALLFGAAFIARRRFGLLGLALAAGSFLSDIWGRDAGLVAGMFNIPDGFLTSAIIASLIVLLPAVVLLFHGYTYKTMVGRIIGSTLFSVLAMAFLVEPLGRALIVQGVGSDIYNLIVNNRSLIIGVGLIAAVIDLFLTKPAPANEKKSKH